MCLLGYSLSGSPSVWLMGVTLSEWPWAGTDTSQVSPTDKMWSSELSSGISVEAQYLSLAEGFQASSSGHGR